ncbi:MAG: glutathione S-transferase family protein, partial [Acinetobacter sp.]|nr:glutathione S-transferase family protein [Acinetobacter sp.]
PKGYVPALEINPGLILTENVAILPFLAQHDPKQDLIPPSGLGRAKVLEWLGYLNSELHDAYAVFFGAPLSAEAKEKAYAEIDRLLTYIDKTIGESDNDYLVDDNFGPADAYLFVLTNWSNGIEHDLTPYKNIIALRNKVAERQSVQIAMRDEGLIA